MNVLKLTRRALLMLCLALVFCSGCKKEKQRHYDLLPPDPENVTAQGLLSVNIENSGGQSAAEGSIRVTDGFDDTKFLIFSYAPNFWMQLKFKAAQHITSYSLTSANDAPERDPKNWTLSGSNDGNVWKDLDTRTNETFAGRKVTNSYEFTNPDTYTYYKLSITANGGGTLFQLAEWRVINVPLQ
jgi:hypothetical protein